MSKIIVVCASKGGVGKSTIALNLARAFMDVEMKVQAIDLDWANQSLLGFAHLWRERTGGEGPSPLPPIMSLDVNFTNEQLVRLASTVDVTVVDMQAGYQNALPRVAKVADLVLVPGQVSPKDWRPTLQTAANIAGLASQQGGRPIGRIVLNKVNLAVNAEAEATQFITTTPQPLPVSRAIIPQRTRISTAGDLGMSVFDYGYTREDRRYFRELATEAMEILGLVKEPV